MPFDGTNYRHTEAVCRLDRAISLLAREDRWVKRALETADGRRCIMGALRAANAEMLEPFVCHAIEELVGKRLTVVAFNDHHTTTHAMVMRVMTRARQLAAEAETMTRATAPPPLRLRKPRLFSWLKG
jgi:class 3 adenylate cyclase